MTFCIGRRQFIALLGGAVVVWPSAAVAQTPGRIWKIGVLANEAWPPLEGRGMGCGIWVTSKERVISSFAQGRAERFPALASELVNLPVDLIVAWGTPASLAAQGVLVVADPFLAGERVRIAEQMIKNRLPSIYSYHEHVVAGGLMAYTTNYYDVFRREGLFIDKIFKGAKAGDLPVQQPTKFELVLNLKTAIAARLSASHAASGCRPCPKDGTYAERRAARRTKMSVAGRSQPSLPRTSIRATRQYRQPWRHPFKVNGLGRERDQ